MIGFATLFATLVGYACAPGMLVGLLTLATLRAVFGGERFFDRAIRIVCRAALLAFAIRVRRSGIANLDPRTRYLFVANHVSILDPIALHAALPGPLRGVELEDHFRWPLWGAVTRRAGNIPISQRNVRAAMKSLAAAASLLRAHASIIILPEGHRTRDGRLGHFMRGPFRLARASGAPIAPIAMIGMYERKNVHSLLVRPGVVRIVIGRPIRIDASDPRTDRNITTLVRGTIERMIESSASAT